MDKTLVMSYSYSCIDAFSKNREIIKNRTLNSKLSSINTYPNNCFHLSGERDCPINSQFYFRTLNTFKSNNVFTEESFTHHTDQGNKKNDINENKNSGFVIINWIKSHLKSIKPFFECISQSNEEQSRYSYFGKKYGLESDIILDYSVNSTARSEILEYLREFNLKTKETESQNQEHIIQIDVTPLMNNPNKFQKFIDDLKIIENKLNLPKVELEKFHQNVFKNNYDEFEDVNAEIKSWAKAPNKTNHENCNCMEFSRSVRSPLYDLNTVNLKSESIKQKHKFIHSSVYQNDYNQSSFGDSIKPIMLNPNDQLQDRITFKKEPFNLYYNFGHRVDVHKQSSYQRKLGDNYKKLSKDNVSGIKRTISFKFKDKCYKYNSLSKIGASALINPNEKLLRDSYNANTTNSAIDTMKLNVGESRDQTNTTQKKINKFGFAFKDCKFTEADYHIFQKGEVSNVHPVMEELEQGSKENIKSRETNHFTNSNVLQKQELINNSILPEYNIAHKHLATQNIHKISANDLYSITKQNFNLIRNNEENNIITNYSECFHEKNTVNNSQSIDNSTTRETTKPGIKKQGLIKEGSQDLKSYKIIGKACTDKSYGTILNKKAKERIPTNTEINNFMQDSKMVFPIKEHGVNMEDDFVDQPFNLEKQVKSLKALENNMHVPTNGEHKNSVEVNKDFNRSDTRYSMRDVEYNNDTNLSVKDLDCSRLKLCSKTTNQILNSSLKKREPNKNDFTDNGIKRNETKRVCENREKTPAINVQIKQNRALYKVNDRLTENMYNIERDSIENLRKCEDITEELNCKNVSSPQSLYSSVPLSRQPEKSRLLQLQRKQNIENVFNRDYKIPCTTKPNQSTIANCTESSKRSLHVTKNNTDPYVNKNEEGECIFSLKQKKPGSINRPNNLPFTQNTSTSTISKDSNYDILITGEQTMGANKMPTQNANIVYNSDKCINRDSSALHKINSITNSVRNDDKASQTIAHINHNITPDVSETSSEMNIDHIGESNCSNIEIRKASGHKYTNQKYKQYRNIMYKEENTKESSCKNTLDNLNSSIHLNNTLYENKIPRDDINNNFDLNGNQIESEKKTKYSVYNKNSIMSRPEILKKHKVESERQNHFNRNLRRIDSLTELTYNDECTKSEVNNLMNCKIKPAQNKSNSRHWNSSTNEKEPMNCAFSCNKTGCAADYNDKLQDSSYHKIRHDKEAYCNPSEENISLIPVLDTKVDSNCHYLNPVIANNSEKIYPTALSRSKEKINFITSNGIKCNLIESRTTKVVQVNSTEHLYKTASYKDRHDRRGNENQRETNHNTFNLNNVIYSTDNLYADVLVKDISSLNDKNKLILKSNNSTRSICEENFSCNTQESIVFSQKENLLCPTKESNLNMRQEYLIYSKKQLKDCSNRNSKASKNKIKNKLQRKRNLTNICHNALTFRNYKRESNNIKLESGRKYCTCNEKQSGDKLHEISNEQNICKFTNVTNKINDVITHEEGKFCVSCKNKYVLKSNNQRSCNILTYSTENTNNDRRSSQTDVQEHNISKGCCFSQDSFVLNYENITEKEKSHCVSCNNKLNLNEQGCCQNIFYNPMNYNKAREFTGNKQKEKNKLIKNICKLRPEGNLYLGSLCYNSLIFRSKKESNGIHTGSEQNLKKDHAFNLAVCPTTCSFSSELGKRSEINVFNGEAINVGPEQSKYLGCASDTYSNKTYTLKKNRQIKQNTNEKSQAAIINDRYCTKSSFNSDEKDCKIFSGFKDSVVRGNTKPENDTQTTKHEKMQISSFEESTFLNNNPLTNKFKIENNEQTNHKVNSLKTIPIMDKMMFEMKQDPSLSKPIVEAKENKSELKLCYNSSPLSNSLNDETLLSSDSTRPRETSSTGNSRISSTSSTPIQYNIVLHSGSITGSCSGSESSNDVNIPIKLLLKLCRDDLNNYNNKQTVLNFDKDIDRLEPKWENQKSHIGMALIEDNSQFDASSSPRRQGVYKSPNLLQKQLKTDSNDIANKSVELIEQKSNDHIVFGNICFKNIQKKVNTVVKQKQNKKQTETPKNRYYLLNTHNVFNDRCNTNGNTNKECMPNLRKNVLHKSKKCQEVYKLSDLMTGDTVSNKEKRSCKRNVKMVNRSNTNELKEKGSVKVSVSRVISRILGKVRKFQRKSLDRSEQSTIENLTQELYSQRQEICNMKEILSCVNSLGYQLSEEQVNRIQ